MSNEKLIFFSIPFDKGWSIFVDGRKVETLKVNIGFIGAVIPSGEHQIEVIHTRGKNIGFTIISIIGLAVFIGLIIMYQRIRKN